ncbi:hypothetical protein NPIL_434991 [Nephila pilipes]|uniref:Uncharacterized protein n=1 Tax=Nephila pilipes TaxID=299642 RepID=A0A8X6UP86_NEPPI|nr:hypothetical protein NPIL_434991 [Nephila pilipes]
MLSSDMPKRMEDERKKRKLWWEKRMAKAVEAVREKMGYLNSRKMVFQVPIVSLFRLVNNKEKNANLAASTTLGRKLVLPRRRRVTNMFS